MATPYDRLVSGLGYDTTPKEVKVDHFSKLKQSRLDGNGIPTPDDMYRMTVGEAYDEGNGPSKSQLEFDLKTMGAAQLRNKYGAQADELISGRADAQRSVSIDMQSNPTGSERGVDLLASLANGAATSIGGLGSLIGQGIDAVTPTESVGSYLAEKTQAASDWINGYKSTDYEARHKVVDARAANQEADRAYAAEQRIKRGDSTFISEMREIGQGVIDSIGRTVNDGGVLAAGVAEAGGSLFTGSFVGSGLRKGGTWILEAAIKGGLVTKGSTAANALAKYGDKINMPLAIAGTEAGSAYQQTVIEVLGMDHDQLLESSPVYESMIKEGMSADDAKREIATDAGVRAAATVAPAAAAAGVLVSKFERNPFTGGKGLLSNMLREATEEGIQGGVSGYAQNEAIQKYADRDRKLSQGLGDQIGLGMLYGAGIAGVVGSPNAGVKAVVETGKAIRNDLAKLAERGISFMDNKRQAGVTSDANVAASVDAVRANEMPDPATVAAEVSAEPAQQAEAEAYVSKINEAFWVRPQDIEVLQAHPSLVQKVSEQTGMHGILANLAQVVIDENNSSNEREAATQVIASILEDLDTMAVNEPDAILALPEDHPIRDMGKIAAAISSSPTMQNMLNQYKQSLAAYETEQGVVPQDATPEVAQTEAGKAAALAQERPDKVNPDVAKSVLYHSRKGNIRLTDAQTKALESALVVAETVEAFNKTEAANGLRPRDFVSQQVLTEKGWDKNNQPSALGHMRKVALAVKQRDPARANKALADMRLFAEHMSNKVAAINEHIASSDWNEKGAVRYQSLTPARTWLPSAKGMYLNPSSDTSIQLAQKIGAEAVALADLYNGMAKVFPELEHNPIDPTALDSRVSGTTLEVKQRFIPLVRQPAKAKPEVKQEAPKTKVEPTPEPVVQEEVKAPEPKVEEAPVIAEETQPEPKVVEPKEQKPAIKDAEMDEAIDTEKSIARPAPKSKEAAQNAAIEDVPVAEEQKFVTDTFSKALKRGINSKLGKVTDVIQTVTNQMSTGANLKKALGEAVTFSYGSKTAGAYRQLMSIAEDASRAMDERLQYFLDSPYSKTDSTPKRVKWKAGTAYPTFLTGQALNITVENVDGSITYDQNLKELAVLASLQWMLTEYRSGQVHDVESVANILGLDEDMIDEDHVRFFNDNTRLADAVGRISARVKQYWDVSPNRDVSAGTSEGIIEGVIKEALGALEEGGLITTQKLRTTGEIVEGNSKPDNFFTFLTIKLNQDQLNNDLYRYPNLLDKLILREREDTFYIGEKPSSPMRTQVNNPAIENTKDQLEVLAFEDGQPYYLDTAMMDFISINGADIIDDLFGPGEFNTQNTNKKHAATLIGRRNSLLLGFNVLGKAAIGISSAANALGVSTDEVATYFKHGFNRVERMQQLGRANPQAHKLIREALLTTWSTLDLTSEVHNRAWYSALGQALGLKMQRETLKDTYQKVNGLLNGKLAPSIAILRAWQQDTKRMSPADLAVIQKALENEGHPEIVFKAMMEYARSLDADPKSFRTSLYFEMDGVSNGVANSITVFNVGPFTAHDDANYRRIGLYYGQDGMTMNKHIASVGSDYADMYETLANNYRDAMIKNKEAMEDRVAHLKIIKNTRKLDTQEWFEELGAKNFFASINFMDLLSKNFTLTPTTMEVLRNLMKNPMTQLTYQAGKRSIAKRIAQELTEKLYERMTDAGRAMQDNPALSIRDVLFDTVEDFDIFVNDYNTLFFDTKESPNRFNVRTAEDAFNFEIPRRIFNDKFIDRFMNAVSVPLIDEGLKMLGDGNRKVNTSIVQSTGIQSIVYASIFRQEYDKLVSAKEGRDKSLSPVEMASIFENNKDLAALIQTDKQRWLIGKSKAIPDTRNEYAETLGGGLSTPVRIYVPAPAGVSGAPNLTIGIDGFMMQLMSQNQDMTNTTKIYDGVNVPLDKYDEYAEIANKAVYDSWTENSTLQGLSESYDTFLKAYENVSVDTATLEEIARVLNLITNKQSLSDLKGADYDNMLNLINYQIKHMSVELASNARSAKARANTMKRVNLSVDQMAGANIGYTSPGLVELVGSTFEEYGDQLNAIYQEELAKLPIRAAVAKPEPQKLTVKEMDKMVTLRLIEEGVYEGKPAPKEYGRTLKGDRVKVSRAGLKQMIKDGGATSDQLVMFDVIMKNNSLKGYTIVLDANFDSNPFNNGMTDPVSKTITLKTTDPEVAIHEMIHAATFEVTNAYYNGADLGPNADGIRAAMNNLRALRDEFMAMDASDLAGSTANDLKVLMNEILSDKTNTRANNNARAMNEFMAWVLTNEPLIAQAKVGIFQRAWNHINEMLKALFFGSAKAPKPLNDILSNVQFNTSVLVRAQAGMDTATKSAISNLYHSTAYGSSQDLLRINSAMDTLLGQNILNSTGMPSVKAAAGRQVRETQDYKSMVVRSHNLLNAFTNAGFKMNMQEATTFRKVVAVLGTQAVVNAGSLNRLQELYENVLKQLDTSTFLVDKESTDPAELAEAKMKYDALTGKLYRFTDSQGRTGLLSSFLALALVNQEFKDVLETIKVPKAERHNWKSVDGFFENLTIEFTEGVAKFAGGEGQKTTTTDRAIAELADTIAEVAEDRKNFIEDGLDTAGSKINDMNDFTVKKMGELGPKISEAIGKRRAQNITKLEGALLTAGDTFAALLQEETTEQAAMGMMSKINRLNTDSQWKHLFTPLKDIVNTIVGRTAENADVFDMIKLARSWLERIRNDFKNSVPKFIAEKFSRDLSDREWNVMYNAVGKTDIAGMLSGFTVEEILQHLQDASAAVNSIGEIENSIKALRPDVAPKLLKKSKQLATYMMTGEYGSNLLRNAYQVANLYNEGAPKAYKADQDMIDLVDQLVSLYALDMVGTKEKAVLNKLASDEAEGMAFVLGYIRGQRKDETANAGSGMGRMNGYKGYIPAENQSGHSLITAPDKQQADLEAQGYTRLETYRGSNIEGRTPPMGYYFRTISGRAPFMQGIIKNARESAFGVDNEMGTTMHMGVAGRIYEPEIVDALVKNMHREKGVAENLLPIRNEDGKIIAFERGLDPKMLATVQRSNHMAKMLGTWRGRQAEEEVAKVINRELIDRLKKMYDADQVSKTAADNEYTDLFDEAMLEKNPVLKDAVALFTPDTRRYAKEVFGTRFMVRNDMLNDVAGYRAPSIRDAWTGISNWDAKQQKQVRNAVTGLFDFFGKGDKAFEYMIDVEEGVQFLVKEAKVIITVKSALIPAMNMLSNIRQLVGRGVPVLYAYRNAKAMMAETTSYIKSNYRKIEIEAALRTLENDPITERKLRLELKSIEDAHKRMSIWPLIERGELTSISDVDNLNDSVDMAEGKLSKFLSAQVDKLPDNVVKAGRYALIAQDTPLYRALQRSVEYGDFLAKAVYYKHMVENKGVDKNEALGRVSWEYIHYDRHPGRFRQALESLGLIWFYNYKLGSIRVAASMLQNNPLHSLIANSMPIDAIGSVGSPVSDNLISVGLRGNLGYSIGPSMGFNAPSMMPTYSAIIG